MKDFYLSGRGDVVSLLINLEGCVNSLILGYFALGFLTMAEIQKIDVEVDFGLVR